MHATLLSLAVLLLGQATPAPAVHGEAAAPVAHPAEAAPAGVAPAAVQAAAATEGAHVVIEPAHAAPAPAAHGAVQFHPPAPAHDGAAAPHGAAAEQGTHGGKHRTHDTSVAGVIFHHVSDESCVLPIVYDKQAGGFLVGAAGLEACEAVTEHEEGASARFLNLSISKLVISMWIASALLVLVLLVAVGKKAMVPKGLYNFIESLVVFIRDEIAIKNIGEHGGHHYTPYLCTAFFFILFANLFGLIPLGAVGPFPGIGTATGNLSVTVVLALFTFAMTQIAGMRAQGVVGYWSHLVPSGVPKALYPIMLPVEFLGLFTKPFALTVRLFANMLAGHIVIYFLIALTVLLSQYMAPVSVAFALGIYMLELFVALVQAYVFTMLSALFIGMASHAH